MAKRYQWAEQADKNGNFDGNFINWPRSLYEEVQTNSNTFARYVIESVGIPFVKMAGFHPGNDEPSQNVQRLEWWAGIVPGGTALQFLASEPPWKTTNPRPEPPQW